MSEKEKKSVGVLVNAEAEFSDGTKKVIDFAEPECTLVIEGKEFTNSGCYVEEGVVVQGYISLKEKNSKDMVLKSWNGAITITNDVYLIGEFGSPFDEFSTYIVRYKTKWYFGGCNGQLFVGKPNVKQLEEYLEDMDEEWDEDDDELLEDYGTQDEWQNSFIDEYIRHIQMYYENDDVSEFFAEEDLKDYERLMY